MEPLWISKYKLVFIMFIISELSCEKTITLTQENPYNQNQTFFNNEHNFVFHSQVTVTEDIESFSEINFQIKSKTYKDFQMICYIDVELCERQKEENCHCQYNSTDNIYLITINITAKVSFSLGTVRGVLIFKDYSVYSNEMKLPMIFAYPESVCLFVNDTKIPDLERCNVTTDKDFAVIIFFCSSASSYKLEIEDGIRRMSNDSNVLVHTVNTTTQKDIRLYQRDLESNVVLRHYQCRLQAALLIIFLSLGFIMYYKYKFNEEKRKNINGKDVDTNPRTKRQTLKFNLERFSPGNSSC
ncbi:uncharacterized protein LOC106064814 isoform X2 [Biomphalaria glabrata]|uniref:Uncharacterized protein LOC106064814 isoform X2 n=1 Tax=Biomphalaria glabrata TaxID=6526 RepID=A0A9W2YTB3_BIOGL|nr:uncharacterized protein LOC106064814 isoform X2 [Biomphalaria glabrata]